MDINDFQRRAFATDESKRTTISLYGLAGEVGTIFSAFKKRLRDRQNPNAFREELVEELGDALWY
jgi:NTP pyrophosphatase (non-canonical NTP hydrolase)